MVVWMVFWNTNVTEQLAPSCYSLTLLLSFVMWNAHWIASLGKLDVETCFYAELPVASKEVHSPEDTWEQDPADHVQGWNADYLDISGRSASAFCQIQVSLLAPALMQESLFISCSVALAATPTFPRSADSLTLIYPSSCCTIRLLPINAWRILARGKCVLTGDDVGCPLHLKFADLALIGTFTV